MIIEENTGFFFQAHRKERENSSEGRIGSDLFYIFIFIHEKNDQHMNNYECLVSLQNRTM